MGLFNSGISVFITLFLENSTCELHMNLFLIISVTLSLQA